MELKVVDILIPEGANLILGHAHFIKTVEDLYEIMVTSGLGVQFGLAFSEASGECLIRLEGNDQELLAAAAENARRLAAGHTFNILLRQAFPINMLNAIKQCQEVCTIHCATANPVQVVVAQTQQGCGILGVIDGFSPKGVEQEAGRAWRYDFLRQIQYKR
ncbi:MAG: adenosine-specific kinase [Desulfobacca sp.]|uniref:adenosine-specific kinase n=1 Tax=Desulfobacca sp. TaxID=2067990 RepID=UPI00404AFBE0